MDNLLILLIAGGLGGLIGALIGNTRHRQGAGCALGFFFGPIGWIIVLLLPAGPAPVKTNARPVVPASAYGLSADTVAKKKAQERAWKNAQSE
jgi:hypothetical protein